VVHEARESPLPHPGSAERLHEYWVHGKGAAQIGWGAPGDFGRCVSLLMAHAHFTPDQARGYCNLAHHAALGIYPATHAKATGKGHHGHRSQADQMDGARAELAQEFGINVSDNNRNFQEGDVAVADAERRYTLLPVELRAAGEQPKIGGYAAVFNKPSRNLGGFVEITTPTFFNKSRGDGWPDVRARYNHDDNMLLGTTGAGTLALKVDDVGLDYEVIPPHSRADVTELVQRGDVRKSSYAFRCLSGGDEWALSEQGYPLRSLVSGQLVDVAPLSKEPAYLDTTAAQRSLADRFDASPEEVRSMAESNDLRRFFVRSDQGSRITTKPRVFGPSAKLALLARKSDPWE
jgi:HK97 family phage prohead protease